MADQPFHMFTYWVDDKDLERALKEYYPSTLINDPVIADAYRRLIQAKKDIMSRMAKLNGDEDDSDNN